MIKDSMVSKGKHHSTESRLKQSISMKKKLDDPETRLRWSQCQKGITRSVEVRANMSVGMRKRFENPKEIEKLCASAKLSHSKPEYKEHMSIAINKPETKAKISASAKITNAKPEIHAKRSVASKISQNRPEVRAKRSISLKRTYARPEVKAKLSASLKRAFANPEVRAKMSTSGKLAQKLARQDPNNWLFNHRGNTSARHNFLETRTCDLLRHQEWNVWRERFVRFNGHNYAVDVYAEKNGEVLIYEVGGCHQQKLNDLMSHYPRVIHIPYTEEDIVCMRLENKLNREALKTAQTIKIVFEMPS